MMADSSLGTSHSSSDGSLKPPCEVGILTPIVQMGKEKLRWLTRWCALDHTARVTSPTQVWVVTDLGFSLINNRGSKRIVPPAVRQA